MPSCSSLIRPRCPVTPFGWLDSIFGVEEQKTLWYFSEKAEAIAELPLHSEEVNSNPVGIRSLYLMTAGNEPVLLARYGDHRKLP